MSHLQMHLQDFMAISIITATWLNMDVITPTILLMTICNCV